MAWQSWTLGEYEISTDPAKIDVGVVHWFLTNCYWARGIPEEVVRRSIENSICFGLYKNGKQAGFARHYRPRDVRLCSGCFHPAAVPGPRPFAVADGVHSGASRFAGTAPLGAGHRRHSRSL